MAHNFLENQVCLVTGGAQGIGWAIAQALADHGGRVYICDISNENLARAAQELGASPWSGQITLSRCDVSNRAEFEHWIENIYRETGQIDVLVNNAAFIRWESVADTPVEDAERMMAVGYFGMIYGVKAVLPLMQSAKRGHIVNLGSSAGQIFATPSLAAYAAVKAAINGYTQVLQNELQGSPLCVTLVRPAVVAGTDFFRKHVSSSRVPRLADFLPPATPPQVAAAVVRAIRERRLIVDVPGYLPVMYFLYAVAPRFFRRLFNLGKGGQRDYGKITWQYKPRRWG